VADEPFKATDEDWQRIEERALNRWDRGRLDLRWDRTIHELRDRVAALEAAPDRVLVRNQTGEYLKAGTPVYADTPLELDADAVLSLAAIIRSVDGAHNLGAAALAEAILSHPDATGVLQLPHDPLRQGLQDQLIADLSDEELVVMWINDGRNTADGLRFVWDHGYQQGLAAGRAEQGGTPEPNQAPAGDGGLVEVVARAIDCERSKFWTNEARDVVRAVAKWLRMMNKGSRFYDNAAYLLDQEAQR
jgi:hypothetical protein